MLERQLGPFKIIADSMEIESDHESIRGWIDCMIATAKTLFLTNGSLRPVIIGLSFPKEGPPMMLTIDLAEVMSTSSGSSIIGALIPGMLRYVGVQAMLYASETWMSVIDENYNQNLGGAKNQPNRVEGLMFHTEMVGKPQSVMYFPIERNHEGQPTLGNPIVSYTMSGRLANFLTDAEPPN